MLQHFPVCAVHLRCAALLPPGAARRTLCDRQTAVLGGATGLFPKAARASVAIAEDWSGDDGAGIEMGVTGIICYGEMKF